MQLTDFTSWNTSSETWLASFGRSNLYLLQLKELYRYRSLIWNLVIRELKARYRGSVMGFMCRS